MHKYLNMLRTVLINGKKKIPTRYNNETGLAEPLLDERGGVISTIAVPNVVFQHDMHCGFPLVTTKPMAWKAIKVELEGFIKGISSKKWYQERGCKIWNEWANPVKVRQRIEQEFAITDFGIPIYIGENRATNDRPEDKKRIQSEENDLGPVYGVQGRRFNQCYDENDQGWVDESVAKDADQLKRIADTLRLNNTDRRMVCSYWNPLQFKYMALPPCHFAWNVTVIDNTLNLNWIQRSADLALGVPFDIAHYAMLLLLLAKHANLEPGNLLGTFTDCHLYENQIDGAREQLEREPYPLCDVIIDNNDDENSKYPFDIFKWDYTNGELVDYQYYKEKINFGKIVV